MKDQIQSPPVIVTCENLNETLEFFTNELGFRLEMISPADLPTAAVISGYGKILRLEESSEIKPVFINNSNLEIPNGTNEFVVSNATDADTWHNGRAGMQYRDLIPNRLGGRFIASHIRIEKGGKVPDYVHYHKIRFQMIYCLNGWAHLVYEDQGEHFTMNAGDCVLQPPEIRHRVLECSDKFEVLEIGCPAVHETFAEHELNLPNTAFNPDRVFSGQRFVHHIAENATWTKHGDFDICDTGIFQATNELANVQTLRTIADTTLNIKHSGEFLFFFILKGNLQLSGNEGEIYQLNAGSSFVLPSDKEYSIGCKIGLEVLRVKF
jgi:quercetin dioxygenase-like cupin family protein